MVEIMTLSVIASVVNVVLILSLLYVYGRSFAKFKSAFSAGLFIFAFLFLVHNVLYLYFAITMMPYYASDAQAFGLVFNVLQALAFLVLNLISWK